MSFSPESGHSLPTRLIEELASLPVEQLSQALENLRETERQAVKLFLMEQNPAVWVPLVGPQREAFCSPADVVLYGGAAGGGKTDLAIGLALTEHRRTLFVRREGLQLLPVKDRMEELLGSREGLNSQNGVWVVPRSGPETIDRQVQFGGVPNPGDENKFQGNPRDLLVLDEAANLLESQVRFLLGWVRSTISGQRCRTLMCSNPPTSTEGQWLVQFFAPWLDPLHPNPAQPGELRWYAVINGKDIELEDERPFILVDEQPTYDFDRSTVPAAEVITPQSRTFIPSHISDNPFLLHTGYLRQLQALPEPLRSQMLYGDFQAGMKDGVWQVIPTAWVQAAMDRWEPREPPGTMHSIGVDVSRGGQDEAVISRRHGDWYAELEAFPGAEVPDGPTLGAHVLRVRRDAAPIHVDVVGVGSSVYDFLKDQGVQVIGISGAEKASDRDRTDSFKFRNERSAGYWRLREALDPHYGSTLKLPPDPALKADLCSLTYKILEGNVLAVETKEDVIKRLGRSPDRGDAVIYASNDTQRKDQQVLDYSLMNRAKRSPMQKRMRQI